jgi:basic membrane lipoprotein Med (substrate-binding protein (PBP1-ABC) superfamily)
MVTRRSVLRKAGAASVALAAGLAGCGGDGDDTETEGGNGNGNGDGTTAPGTAGTTAPGTTGTTAPATTEGETITAAYVYDEPISDTGWTNTHEVARKALEEELDWYETQVTEDVPPSEAQQTFETLAQEGVDVIEAATFDYGTPAASVVQEFDDLYIETPRMVPVEDYTGPQLGYYLGQLEDACYATGVAAGMVTETNVLGYVMPFSIASTVTELNALMQGVKSVNSDAELILRFTDSWYDPQAEQEAAQSLVDENADVLGYRVSTPTTMEVAADNDLWSYGYADSFVGTDVEYDKYITSRMWDWSSFYRATAEAARQGNAGDIDRFNVEDFRGNYFGMADGGVTLDDYGSAVPSDVISEVDDVVSQLENDEIEGADIFEGTQYADMSAYDRVSSASEYVDGITNPQA